MLQFINHLLLQLHTMYTAYTAPTSHIMKACVGLVLILVFVSQEAAATPVRATRSVQTDHAHCTARARHLLNTLKLDTKQTEKTLFYGFNCTDLEAMTNPNTETASVCQPNQNAKCHDSNTFFFNKDTCLQNIANDLDYHQSMLTEYVSTLNEKSNPESIKELNSIKDSIHHLQQHCKLLPAPESLKNLQKWHPSKSFENRKDLCKILKGFQVRTLTINRALGYVCAQEV